MLSLQTFASQGGFWIFMAVMAVVMIGAAVWFRVPGDETDRFTLREFFALTLCVLVALGLWYVLATFVPV